MTAAKSIKITLFTLIFVLLLPGAFAAQPALSEGFLVKGGYGRLIEPNNLDLQTSRWSFEFTDEYSTEEHTIQIGAEFPLLKSSALGQVIQEQKEAKPNREYRIWAMTTKFKESNFLYPVYFLPVRQRTEKTEPPAPDQPEEANETAKPASPNEPETADDTESSREESAMNEPEDAVKVPDEILDRLEDKRTYTPEPVEPETEEKKEEQEQPDSEKSEKKQTPEPQPSRQFKVLTSQVGYINKNENEQYIFKVEGYGKKLSKEIYYLQPCRTLEKAIQEQSETLNKPRFRIAGITDTFGGKKYLLLHRAVFKYSYGNFGR